MTTPKPVAWRFQRAYGSGLSFVRPADYEDEDGNLVQPEPLYPASAIEQAVREEREACARIAEEHYIPGHTVAGPAFAAACAKAIRARD
jgi:hypothetical protein